MKANLATDLSPDLTHVGVWLFDLDNTLYPVESGLMGLIEVRMTDFVQRETGLSRPEARALQKQYLHEHGATLAGLIANHGVDPQRFLDEVHDVSLDRLTPDLTLDAALARLPGRRLVFTNGDDRHADRVLERLGIADRFEAVFHIASAGYVPKPNPDTFARMSREHDIDPRVTAFFEDSERNLAPAAALGMTTVLVGAQAQASTATFIDYRTPAVAPFLNAARVKETSES